VGKLDAVAERATGGKDGIAELKGADPDAEVYISRGARVIGSW
jgi:hypothetical protein